MKPENRKLYEIATYARTERLEMLTAQAQVLVTQRPKTEWPNHRDMTELWSIYTQQCNDVGYTPTLTDFADWIGGYGPYEPYGLPAAIYI